MWASFANAPDVLPEFECKTGCLIECELRDHDRKFLGFLFVGTTQLLSKGPGGAWIKVECLATNDSWFLTWCDSHGGGGRSLRLHLCTSPPKTCSCTDGQREQEFYSESWRRITRKNVTQGDLKRSSLRWHTTTTKVMLDPLLGLTQHQQTLLKRLAVRIWPRLMQKQVRPHGVRWPRLPLQLHRHQNVSLLLLRKWQARRRIVAAVQMPCAKNIRTGIKFLLTNFIMLGTWRSWVQFRKKLWPWSRHILAPTSQSLNEYSPPWARCSPQRRRQISCRWTWIWWWASSMERRHSLPELLVKLLGWKWQSSLVRAKRK